MEPRSCGDVAPGDQPYVWLASYPKSGNTWTRVLLANVLHPDAEEDGIPTIGSITCDRPAFDNCSGLASSDLTSDEIDRLRPAALRKQSETMGSDPVFVKTHDALYRNDRDAWIFPPDCSRGVILIVRHPCDVAVSYMHHQGSSDIARIVRQMRNRAHVMAGHRNAQMHQRTMGWSGHYLSWKRQDAIPVLVVRYEDMLADTAAQLTRVLRFVGVSEAMDAERVAAAVARSRFDRLQRLEAETGFAERSPGALRFFRSGRAGEGIATLSAELQAEILRDHGEVMHELGYTIGGIEGDG